MLPPGDGVPAGLLKQGNENKQLFFFFMWNIGIHGRINWRVKVFGRNMLLKMKECY